jgi:V8-like Glu-specific endopeptidase
LATSIVLAGLLISLSLPTIAAEREGVVETFPERARGGIDPLDYLANQEQLQAWLVSEMPAGTMGHPIMIQVTTEEMNELDRVDAEDPGKTVVGLTKTVSRPIDLSRLNRGMLNRSGKPFAGGSIRSTDDGGFVWAVAVTSEGASAMRINFRNLRLPGSADLFLYNLNGQAFGPYRDGGSDGVTDLWSNTVLGSTAIVQLRFYGAATPRELAQLKFTIAEIGHIGPKFQPAASANADKAFCPQNASCIENTNCSGGPAWGAKTDAENATALMLWISGAFINTCTGGLINDTDGSSQIPYFLTANHCLSKNNNAANLETFFQFQVNCGGNCPPQWTGGGIQRLGSSLVATGRSGDYTLLELSQTPPSGSVFMGWTTADVANSNGTDLFRISHPATAPQAYSAQTVDTSAGTCRGVPRGNWIYSRNTHGATEGGSSGSPIYNGAGQVVGQLTGACGFNTGNPCDYVSNATIDGAFANYYDNIAQFLAPGPCSPSPEVCDDGTDNDCDGDADCNDADCSGDPACDSGGGCVNPGGSPPGTSCVSDGECCSNKCKGPPSNKSCR